MEIISLLHFKILNYFFYHLNYNFLCLISCLFSSIIHQSYISMENGFKSVFFIYSKRNRYYLYRAIYNILFGLHIYRAEASPLFALALAFITAIVIILYFTWMSSKHDNCQNNKTNVFGGSRGKERDCEVCSEVKHERFQTGCDTVSFGSAQIKRPFSPRKHPPKSSSPLSALFFWTSPRSKVRKVWDDSWSTRVKHTVSVTESSKRTARGVFTAPFSQSLWCLALVSFTSWFMVRRSGLSHHNRGLSSMAAFHSYTVA